MFRPTSPQRPLFGVEHRMDSTKRARLEKTWAHQYRAHALPLIEEMPFAKYFDPENGRPNKSVRLLVSVLLRIVSLVAQPQSPQTVVVRAPGGIVVEGLDAKGIAALVRALA